MMLGKKPKKKKKDIRVEGDLSTYENALVEMLARVNPRGLPTIEVSPNYAYTKDSAVMGQYSVPPPTIELFRGRYEPSETRGLGGFSGQSPMTPEDSSVTLAHEFGHFFRNPRVPVTDYEADADSLGATLRRVLTNTHDPRRDSNDMLRWLSMIRQLRGE